MANLTASRVSTERVRKLRLFQPAQYLSLDYARQDVLAFSVHADRQIGFEPVAVEKSEPLKLELDSFFECVETRDNPKSPARTQVTHWRWRSRFLIKLKNTPARLRNLSNRPDKTCLRATAETGVASYL